MLRNAAEALRAAPESRGLGEPGSASQPIDALLVSASDSQGGAARAAHRLLQGLCEIGAAAEMLVLEQSESAGRVTPLLRSAGERRRQNLRAALEKRVLRAANGRRPRSLHSLQWLGASAAFRINAMNPALVNLHWVSGGTLCIEELAAIRAPLVWTLHDMSPFTGGCHYAGDCRRFRGRCGKCPNLGSRRERDLSRWVWRRKAKAWRSLHATLVSPSQWLAAIASESSLFADWPIAVIPNGLDLETFQPIERAAARRALGISGDAQVVAYGAATALKDARKGYGKLLAALAYLESGGRSAGLELVAFGAERPAAAAPLGLPTHYLGVLRDDRALARVCSAADVFVAPSLEDDLPNTVMEALACGTPLVAFDTGGIRELVDHERTGYLAPTGRVAELAEGILWCLEAPRNAELSEAARKTAAERFSQHLAAQRYRELFAERVAAGRGADR